MQIFSRFSILLTIFNQIWIKNYQIKTNKIFNFSHKISQKRHFVPQKWQFLCEINDIFKKKCLLFSPNPDSPAAYRGNNHPEKPRDSRSPGGGGVSGGMVAHDLVNGWQATA